MRDTLGSTLRYTVKPQLLALYALTFVGFALYGWNVFAPFYGLFAGAIRPLANLLNAFFGFVTGLVGFSLAIVGFVGILKTVVEDAVDGQAVPGETSEQAGAADEDSSASSDGDDQRLQL